MREFSVLRGLACYFSGNPVWRRFLHYTILPPTTYWLFAQQTPFAGTAVFMTLNNHHFPRQTRAIFNQFTVEEVL